MRDPRLEKVVAWVLATVATTALLVTIRNSDRMDETINKLTAGMVQNTTELKLNSQYLMDLKASLGDLEGRLRAVEKVR